MEKKRRAEIGNDDDDGEWGKAEAASPVWGPVIAETAGGLARLRRIKVFSYSLNINHFHQELLGMLKTGNGRRKAPSSPRFF
jgi:hypothetical protein